MQSVSESPSTLTPPTSYNSQFDIGQLCLHLAHLKIERTRVPNQPAFPLPILSAMSSQPYFPANTSHIKKFTGFGINATLRDIKTAYRQVNQTMTTSPDAYLASICACCSNSVIYTVNHNKGLSGLPSTEGIFDTDDDVTVQQVKDVITFLKYRYPDDDTGAHDNLLNPNDQLAALKQGEKEDHHLYYTRTKTLLQQLGSRDPTPGGLPLPVAEESVLRNVIKTYVTVLQTGSSFLRSSTASNGIPAVVLAKHTISSRPLANT